MKTYILPLLMMMLISCSNSKTQENESTTVPLPEGKEIYIPKDLRSMDLQDPESKWSYHRMACTENFVIFWEKGFGDNLSDPPQLEGHSMKVNLKNLEEKLEHFYHYFYHTLQFAKTGSKCDKYRMMVMINYSLEGTAYGGDYDGEIGALWIAPNRVQDEKLNCIAHELGHSFQSQITCDGQGEAWGGCGFFEMTSQWMLWQVNPDWMTDEKYHWDAFKTLTHKAYLHLENIYHSPYVIEYWSMKRGLPFIAELYRQGKRGEDPVMTYKRMTPQNCPENYGFNAIPLSIPPTGQTVTIEFCGEADKNGFHTINADKAGWRYGIVTITKEGKAVYGEMKADPVGKISYAVPENSSPERLWFIVMGAPAEHWINPNQEEKDAQWPYRIRITGSQPIIQ